MLKEYLDDLKVDPVYIHEYLASSFDTIYIFFSALWRKVKFGQKIYLQENKISDNISSSNKLFDLKKKEERGEGKTERKRRNTKDKLVRSKEEGRGDT